MMFKKGGGVYSEREGYILGGAQSYRCSKGGYILRGGSRF